MKRIIISLLLVALYATNLSAQVTYNQSVGIGFLSEAPCVAIRSQVNVPFHRSAWMFSPSVNAAVQFDGWYQVYVPLQVGYKVHMGSRNFFVPKFGFAFGYQDAHANSAIVAPSVSLDLEIKHFVIGANFFYSLTGGECYSCEEIQFPYGAFLSFGYKF